MAVRPFYLHLRGTVWFAQITNPATGKAMSARSTGESDRDKAVLVAARWLQTGQLPARRKEPAPDLAGTMGFDALAHSLRTASLSPEEARRLVRILSGRGLLKESSQAASETVASFLTRFWTWESSPYVKELVAHGRTLGKTHANIKLSSVRKYWTPFMGTKALSSVRTKDLEEMAVFLKGQGLTTATVNRVITTGTTALSWAFKKEIIQADPTLGLVKFSEKNRVRGILEDQEVRRLFASEWKDERVKVANRVASETGCRLGEIIALNVDAILSDRLCVQRSFSDDDGFKAPKNGSTRFVPITPELRAELLRLASLNPFGDGLVFWGLEHGKPMNRRRILDGFREALEGIGIPVEEQKRRALMPHSFRHGWSVSLGDHVDVKALATSSGHKTIRTLEHYQNHEREADFQKVALAVSSVFGTPARLPFTQEADHAE